MDTDDFMYKTKAHYGLNCTSFGKGRGGLLAARLTGSCMLSHGWLFSHGKCTGSLFPQVLAMLAVVSAHHALLPALLPDLCGFPA